MPEKYEKHLKSVESVRKGGEARRGWRKESFVWPRVYKLPRSKVSKVILTAKDKSVDSRQRRQTSSRSVCVRRDWSGGLPRWSRCPWPDCESGRWTRWSPLCRPGSRRRTSSRSRSPRCAITYIFIIIHRITVARKHNNSTENRTTWLTTKQRYIRFSQWICHILLPIAHWAAHNQTYFDSSVLFLYSMSWTTSWKICSP